MPQPIDDPDRHSFMIDIAADEAADVLFRARNGDGGWGYFPDKASRLEPTAWAILALGGPAAPPRAAAPADMVAALRNWPSTDGVLLEHAGGEPNFAFHGLALLAMLACGAEHTSGNAALVAGMQRVKGMKLGAPNPGSRQNNSLQAWPWFAGTFSWVEPTAWCLLSLKKWAGKQGGGRVDAARVNEAERLLVDRSCAAGGWNFGNADVMGQDLRAYVPTTAIALLAMQDRLNEPAVKRSLDYLEAHATSERSGTALGLALIALRACRRPHEAVRAALVQQLPTTIALRNFAAIALASYALGPEQPHDAFTL